MKIECPTCRKISRLTGELLLTRSEGLEVKCPKCKTHIKLYVLAKSGKDGPLQTAYDPFEDQIGPLAVDMTADEGLQVSPAPLPFPPAVSWNAEAHQGHGGIHRVDK